MFNPLRLCAFASDLIMKIVHGPRCDGGLTPREYTIHAAIEWHYLEWGDHGVPLVLWHGITGDARTWWRVGPTLAGLGFHVFAPDLPGHGSSGDAPDYAATTTATLLDHWLAAIDVGDPIIIGHSWGGMNALTHATLPDAEVRARSLILEDPALLLAADPTPYVPNYTAGLGIPPSQATLDQMAAANPRWHPCDVWWRANAHFWARRAAVEGFFYANAAIDYALRLAQIHVPTSVILGDAQFGGIWQADQIARVAQIAPRAQVEVIEGSTHNLHRDSFDRFMASVVAIVRPYLREQRDERI